MDVSKVEDSISDSRTDVMRGNGAPMRAHAPSEARTRSLAAYGPSRGSVLRQDLIRAVLLSHQPFKCLVRKQAGNERIDDLLHCKYEYAACRVLDFIRV